MAKDLSSEGLRLHARAIAGRIKEILERGRFVNARAVLKYHGPPNRADIKAPLIKYELW